MEHKRICLITPPSIFLLDERVFMNLGILMIAKVLHQAGYCVEMVDLSGVKNYPDAIEDHLRQSPTTLFGITATTPQLPASVEIVKKIRKERKDAKIILGGPHVTLVHSALKHMEQVIGFPGRATRAMDQLQNMFDVCVAGYGEEAIFIACDSNSPKLIDADDPKSSLFPTHKALTELPFPARELIDYKSYHYQIDGVDALSVVCQRGCPFGCIFCGGRASAMLRNIRIRSPENVVTEIEHIWRTTGYRGIMFYDDEINVHPEMEKLMDLIAEKGKELGVEFRLRAFVKSQLLTDKQAEKMYKAGFRWLLVGFESGSDRILTTINKRATRAENTRCMEIAKRHGLKVKALMSVGHPGESFQTIQETKNWLLEVRPDDFDVSLITPYPGTPIYDRALPRKDLGRDTWVYTSPITKDRLYQSDIDFTKVDAYYKGDPRGGYKSYVWTQYLSCYDLVQERGRLEKDVRKILKIPFNRKGSKIHFEHSMGQSGPLPSNILRVSGN